MFPSLGLFKDVPCPQGQDCSLLICFFSHKDVKPHSVDRKTSQIVGDDASTAGPPQKRIKVERQTEPCLAQPKPVPIRKDGDKAQDAKGTPASATRKQPQPIGQGVTKLPSASKAVSPPPRRAEPKEGNPQQTGSSSSTSVRSGSGLPPRNSPKESLNPRMLPKAPATHAVRSSILTKLHAAMSALNDKLAKDRSNENRYLVLAPHEVITMALDEEEKAAKNNPSIYANVIKLRIVKLSKMSQEDWIKEVKAYLMARYYKDEPIQQQQQKPKSFTTGLTTKEEVALSRKLVTPLDGLEQFGYVTKAPSKQEIESAAKGVAESKGWEKCDRCGGRFQVFPGRREDGTLTSGGECTYHPSRPVYPPKKKTDHITGHQEAYYPCCNETIGTSSGCTNAKTHVFKVSETKRLASIFQFEETPAQPDKGPQQPVSFDCEMGYTTLGLELIRLTAVSWPDGKELVDVLVRPMGEVLDLNSRYSGVFPEHYANAVPYGTSTTSSRSEDGEIGATPLQIVESPAAARALLFQFLQPDTPLIGHAIDNDLNACRIIHPAIIDTVLLYPHPRGLPIRMSLKALCRKHLDRDIQTGGDRGHDSKEDAIATGDLVRVKAAETWKVLKSKGWTIQDDKLVPPPGVEDVKGNPAAERALGPGAGQKRKEAAKP